MYQLIFKNEPYLVATDESILSCFLRHGIDYPNSCQAGICQSCLIKAKDGVINPSWQEGLPETLKAQGYFLACMAKPASNLDLEPPDAAECDVEAKIIEMRRLTYNVIKIKLLVDNPGDWIPGQYLNLINSQQLARSYSIANLPGQDGFIELHIKTYENGAMSQWLQETAVIGTQVRLRGPFGKCYYYNPEKLSFDMLLAGTGTGLAPLIAIIKSALSQGHDGNITLVHGGRIDDDIYYTRDLEILCDYFKNFHYDPCVLNSQGRYLEASIEQRVLTHLNKPKATQVYVCGPKETTNKLKTSIFLAGVPSKAIFSDAFL
jgi:NAD(P)H-flavin reductase